MSKVVIGTDTTVFLPVFSMLLFIVAFVELVQASRPSTFNKGHHLGRAFLFIVAALLAGFFKPISRMLARMIGGEAPAAPPSTEPAVNVNFGLLAQVGGVTVGAVILVVGIVIAVRRITRHRARSVAAAALVDDRLAEMDRTVETIAQRIGEIQSDPVTALNFYGLFDTDVPSVATFWGRWIEVSDKVETATRTREIPDGLRSELDATHRAWKVACADAERLGLDAVGPERAPQARRAVKSIALARSTTSEAESALAWQRAAELLAALHLPHLPEPALEAVETQNRPALAVGTEEGHRDAAVQTQKENLR